MGKQVKKHGYSAKLVRVVDGDTADAMIDLGFNVWHKMRIRFYGVDAWESRTRDLEEKKKGLEAKAFVKDLLENSDDAAFSGDIGCPMSGIPCYGFDPMDEILFGKNFGMISDMKFGPDGALYVISLMEGKIYRITLG